MTEDKINCLWLFIRVGREPASITLMALNLYNRILSIYTSVLLLVRDKPFYPNSKPSFKTARLIALTFRKNYLFLLWMRRVLEDSSPGRTGSCSTNVCRFSRCNLILKILSCFKKIHFYHTCNLLFNPSPNWRAWLSTPPPLTPWLGLWPGSLTFCKGLPKLKTGH